MLILALLLVLVLLLVAPGPGKFDRRFTELLQHNGSIWDWLWGMAFAFVLIWPVVLLLMALATRGRRRLVLDSLVRSTRGLGRAVLERPRRCRPKPTPS